MQENVFFIASPIVPHHHKKSKKDHRLCYNEPMAIDSILTNYQTKFKTKEFTEVLETTDLLMNLFEIDPLIKRQNMQYWSRELGMCWQRLVVDVAQSHRTYGPPIRWGDDEPCDLVLGKTAIDTKYRVGSGDSGTLKKMKEYAKKLTDQGFVPVMLILRTDNLQSSVDACESGGWKIYTGQDSFKFIERRTGMDLQTMLLEKLAGQQKAIRQAPHLKGLQTVMTTPLSLSPPSSPMSTTSSGILVPSPAAARLGGVPSLSGLPHFLGSPTPPPVPAAAGL